MSAKPIALLVCGSRTWTDADFVDGVLNKYDLDTWLVHGGAAGADTLAHQHFRQRRISAQLDASALGSTLCVPYFGHLGKRGGYARNTVLAELLAKMVVHGGFEARVEAFDMGTDGTAMMIEIAEAAGFPVRRHIP